MATTTIAMNRIIRRFSNLSVSRATLSFSKQNTAVRCISGAQHTLLNQLQGCEKKVQSSETVIGWNCVPYLNVKSNSVRLFSSPPPPPFDNNKIETDVAVGSGKKDENEEAIAEAIGVDPTTLATDTVHTGADGRQYALITKEYIKLKPSIVKRRLAKCKTYIGKEKNIRHSPWRMNLVCQFVSGMTVPDALTQLAFLNKSKAPLVQKVIQRTANLADIRDSIQPTQLEVAECFATKGKHLKRIKIMGRGRHGIMHRKHSHIRLVLREIDFKLKIYQSKTINQKKKWLQLQMEAERDYEIAINERREMERLEKQQEEMKEKLKEDTKA